VLVSKLESDTSLLAAETALLEHAAKMNAVLKQRDDKIASLKAACKLKGVNEGGYTEALATRLQKRVASPEQRRRSTGSR
jgi:hypothetical protein